MKKPQDRNLLSEFRQEFADIKPLKQDKLAPSRGKPSALNKSQYAQRQQMAQMRQAAASFHFSDGFEAHFPADGPLKYVKQGAASHEVKRLRRGDYPPELILDLHGYNRDDAKLEIAALILAAQKQHIHCVCIVHGLGSHILKKTVPSWLVQHPAILGFHQAPLQWGGQGALLVLIDTPQSEHR